MKVLLRWLAGQSSRQKYGMRWLLAAVMACALGGGCAGGCRGDPPPIEYTLDTAVRRPLAVVEVEPRIGDSCADDDPETSVVEFGVVVLPGRAGGVPGIDDNTPQEVRLGFPQTHRFEHLVVLPRPFTIHTNPLSAASGPCEGIADATSGRQLDNLVFLTVLLGDDTFCVTNAEEVTVSIPEGLTLADLCTDERLVSRREWEDAVAAVIELPFPLGGPR